MAICFEFVLRNFIHHKAIGSIMLKEQGEQEVGVP
jgi:hypothetical protein